MRNIILIEDKTKRDSLVLANIDFEKLSNIETIFGDKCSNFLTKGLSAFEAFDVIMIHQTFIENDSSIKLIELKDYCNDNNKDLVVFSGEGDAINLQNNCLSLPAITFYSNLEVFLKDDSNDRHVLILAYGENWSLNMLLNIIEKLSIYISNHENEGEEFTDDFDEFEDDFELIKLKKALEPSLYDSIFLNIEIIDDEINLCQVKTIKNNLLSLVSEKAYE